MSLQFTPTGVTIQTFEQAFDEIAQQYRDIYGQDINLDPDSPDGQRVGIEAKARIDAQTFLLQLYNSLDPDFASGDRLFSAIKFSGINPRPATRSQWDIDVTTDRDLTLQQDYIIKDDIGQKWFLPATLELTAGTTTVTFRAQDFGAIEGLSTAELTQDTIVLGVTGLSPVGDATVGVEEETEQELRERRNRSLQLPSYSTVGALFARLANTAGVTDVQVYENDTDTYDATRDIDAHTIWVVVEGGTVDDIAEVIAKQKTGGTGLKGSVSGTYNEVRIRPDGSSFTVIHEVEFDRPVDTPIYVRLTATEKEAGDSIDAELIKQKLSEVNYRIGQDAEAGKLYDVAYLAGDNFTVSQLEISDDDVTYTDDALESALDGVFSIDTANVTVTIP